MTPPPGFVCPPPETLVAFESMQVPAQLVAINVAFVVVFGVAVVAFIAMAIYTVVWAVRRDHTGWTAWRQRQNAAPDNPSVDGSGTSPGGSAGRPAK